MGNRTHCIGLRAWLAGRSESGLGDCGTAGKVMSYNLDHDHASKVHRNRFSAVACFGLHRVTSVKESGYCSRCDYAACGAWYL